MNFIKQIIYKSQNPDQIIKDKCYESLNVVFIDELGYIIAVYKWNESNNIHRMEKL